MMKFRRELERLIKSEGLDILDYSNSSVGAARVTVEDSDGNQKTLTLSENDHSHSMANNRADIRRWKNEIAEKKKNAEEAVSKPSAQVMKDLTQHFVGHHRHRAWHEVEVDDLTVTSRTRDVALHYLFPHGGGALLSDVTLTNMIREKLTKDRDDFLALSKQVVEKTSAAAQLRKDLGQARKKEVHVRNNSIELQLREGIRLREERAAREIQEAYEKSRKEKEAAEQAAASTSTPSPEPEAAQEEDQLVDIVCEGTTLVMVYDDGTGKTYVEREENSRTCPVTVNSEPVVAVLDTKKLDGAVAPAPVRPRGTVKYNYPSRSILMQELQRKHSNGRTRSGEEEFQTVCEWLKGQIGEEYATPYDMVIEAVKALEFNVSHGLMMAAIVQTGVRPAIPWLPNARQYGVEEVNAQIALDRARPQAAPPGAIPKVIEASPSVIPEPTPAPIPPAPTMVPEPPPPVKDPEKEAMREEIAALRQSVDTLAYALYNVYKLTGNVPPPDITKIVMKG